tara:strand:+ start:176 stop:1423 length:1248 start_codon:yes stop_codon:yes gene_type:complete
LKNDNFILINLNQNISKARQAAYKGNRDKWIIFGLLCFIYIGLIAWFVNINSNYNELISLREDTISKIKKDTRDLKKEIKRQLENRNKNLNEDNNDKVNLLNLSKKDIELAYKIGEKTIPWSEKLMQLSEITPEDMCITKLEYANNSLNISAISKIKDKTQKDQKILNDFITLLEGHEDFGKEFIEYELRNSKRVSRGSNPYYQFQISAPLKKKIKNRLNDIVIEEEIPKNIEPIIEEKVEAKVTEKVEVKVEEELEEKVEPKVEENKYSDDIIQLAKDIDIKDPLTDNVKKFQTVLKLFSENDIEFGFLESVTIIKRDEILGKKPTSRFQKELMKKNKEIASEQSSIKVRKYSKNIIAAAKRLKKNQNKSNLVAVKRFQEATGIANESSANYGLWDDLTRIKYEDVLQSIAEKQ